MNRKKNVFYGIGGLVALLLGAIMFWGFYEKPRYPDRKQVILISIDALDSAFNPFQKEIRFEIFCMHLGKNKDRDYLMFIRAWMVGTPHTDTHFLT